MSKRLVDHLPKLRGDVLPVHEHGGVGAVETVRGVKIGVDDHPLTRLVCPERQQQTDDQLVGETIRFAKQPLLDDARPARASSASSFRNL
ncbi:MAG: hypothetical protein ABIT36_13350 [Steroidobacteraceae bacterium]